MDAATFEHKILHLWMTTRVPLTRANIQFYVKAPRKKIEGWLDGLVRENILDFDSDEAGEVTWTVRGAERPKTGISSVTELAKLDSLRPSGTNALVRSGTAGLMGGSARALLRTGEGEKSLLAGGALSFVFGPLGWLYAAPLGEAAPAVIVYVLLCMFLPHLLLLPLLGLLNPLSAVVGAAYAWRHNQKGERTPLLPPSSRTKDPR